MPCLCRLVPPKTQVSDSVSLFLTTQAGLGCCHQAASLKPVIHLKLYILPACPPTFLLQKIIQPHCKIDPGLYPSNPNG